MSAFVTMCLGLGAVLIGVVILVILLLGEEDDHA